MRVTRTTIALVILAAFQCQAFSHEAEFVASTDSSGRFLALERIGDGAERSAYLTVWEYLGDDKSLHKLYEAKLLNAYAPLVRAISRDGRFFVTLDEFSRAGTGPLSLVIYDLARKEHSSFSGKDFIKDDVIRSLSGTGFTSGFKWFGKDIEFDEQSRMFYPTRLENCKEEGVPFVVVDLPARTVHVQAALNTDPVRTVPRQQSSWFWEVSQETADTKETALPVRLIRKKTGAAETVFELAPDQTKYAPRKSR